VPRPLRAPYAVDLIRDAGLTTIAIHNIYRDGSEAGLRHVERAIEWYSAFDAQRRCGIFPGGGAGGLGGRGGGGFGRDGSAVCSSRLFCSGQPGCRNGRRTTDLATTMFVRFRKSGCRLHLRLVENRRINGKVRQEHFASLGSIEIPQTIPDRLAFWQQLHERLARLANRLTGEAQGKVLAAVHARIPMVTPDEQHALQLENAEADANFWEGLHGAQTATVNDHKGLAATTAAAVAQGEKAAAETAGNAKTA
jgi:hypothetical protein